MSEVAGEPFDPKQGCERRGNNSPGKAAEAETAEAGCIRPQRVEGPRKDREGSRAMTDHPCKGRPRTQIAAFERIAVNFPPVCSPSAIKALLDAGLIEQGKSITKRDALGTYSIPQYHVPIWAHMQWCQWCSENVTD